jgi:hypothetical protein
VVDSDFRGAKFALPFSSKATGPSVVQPFIS